MARTWRVPKTRCLAASLTLTFAVVKLFSHRREYRCEVNGFCVYAGQKIDVRQFDTHQNMGSRGKYSHSRVYLCEYQNEHFHIDSNAGLSGDLAISADETFLAVAFSDVSDFCIWNIHTEQLIKQIDCGKKKKKNIVLFLIHIAWPLAYITCWLYLAQTPSRSGIQLLAPSSRNSKLPMNTLVLLFPVTKVSFIPLLGSFHLPLFQTAFSWSPWERAYLRGHWIFEGEEELIFLLPDCRIRYTSTHTNSFTYNKTLATGSDSGRVLIIELDETRDRTSR